MEESLVQSILLDNEDLITSFSKQAARKLRRPTMYTQEDLFQEGSIKVLSVLREGKWDPELGFPIRNFLCVVLRNFYKNVITSSYRRNSHMNKVVPYHPRRGTQHFDLGSDEDNSPPVSGDRVFNCVFFYHGPSDFLSCFEGFTPREFLYITEYLCPTEDRDMASFARRTGDFRERARIRLGMSTYEEMRVRNSVFSKLLEG